VSTQHRAAVWTARRAEFFPAATGLPQSHQFPIFVADPPFVRHKVRNSAMQNRNLQLKIDVDMQERLTRHAWMD
jgi:hypothetical protein